MPNWRGNFSPIEAVLTTRKAGFSPHLPEARQGKPTKSGGNFTAKATLSGYGNRFLGQKKSVEIFYSNRNIYRTGE